MPAYAGMTNFFVLFSRNRTINNSKFRNRPKNAHPINTAQPLGYFLPSRR